MLLLTGSGAMRMIIDIMFQTGNGQIGKNSGHSNTPLMANWQTYPEIQGKFAEVFAEFPDAEYRFPAYCFGGNTTGDVRRLKGLLKQIDPPLLVLSLENIFNSAEFRDLEDLLFNALDIAKWLQRDTDVPLILASPTVQLPSEYYEWASAIFDCGDLGAHSRFAIKEITTKIK